MVHSSVFFFLDDIREGDKIECAYSIVGSNQIFFPYYNASIYFQCGEPIGYKSFRLIKEKQQNIFVENRNSSLTPIIKEVDDHLEEWKWEAKSIHAYKEDSNQPVWFDNKASIQISSFESWNDVAKWATPFYLLPEPSEYSKEMLELVSLWKNDFESKEEQALAAIRFVQDKIRYLGFENGINGFKPQGPKIVFERRFGDCKEKAFLLRALLSLLDIESSRYLLVLIRVKF